jgi:hypothetical protein
VEPATEIDSEKQMYRYTCKCCGESMIKSDEPDPNVRGLHSTNSINLRSDDSDHDDTKSTESHHGDSDQTKAETELEAIRVLEEYLEKSGPNKAVARDIMITAADILAEDGPMTTADLKDTLNEIHGEKYSSADSLWESTFFRLYSRIPGFNKVSHGKYDFNEERLNVLINSILEL